MLGTIRWKNSNASRIATHDVVEPLATCRSGAFAARPHAHGASPGAPPRAGASPGAGAGASPGAALGAGASRTVDDRAHPAKLAFDAIEEGVREVVVRHLLLWRDTHVVRDGDGISRVYTEQPMSRVVQQPSEGVQMARCLDYLSTGLSRVTTKVNSFTQRPAGRGDSWYSRYVK